MTQTTITMLVLDVHYGSQAQTLEMHSTCTLLQLAAVLSDLMGVCPHAEHRFENKSQGFSYIPVTDPSHHDGWLTNVGHGIFLSHPHPHEPLSKDSNIDFPVTQVRSQQMWPLSFAFSKQTINFFHPELDLPVILSINDQRPATSEDRFQMIGQQCVMCAVSDCSEDCSAVSGLPCCDFCIRPAHQTWHGQTTPELEAHIEKLASEVTHYITREYKTFFHSSNNNLPFMCQWKESTGEPCAFCTEDFL